MNRFNKRFFYICLFGTLYAITAFSSFWHAIEFFELSNVWWMGIILALAFEIGQAAVLLSILTSSKERSRITPWILMGILTLVQIIGNVYSSYKYIMLNSPENLRYFKEPIFIWTDLPDAEATVIITYISSAILPITALLLTSMITNYLTDQSEEATTKPKNLDTQTTAEKVFENEPDEPVVEQKDKEIEKLGQEVEQPKQEKSEENIQDKSTNKIEENDNKDDSEEIENDSKESKDNSEEIEQKSNDQSMKKQSHFINI